MLSIRIHRRLAASSASLGSVAGAAKDLVPPALPGGQVPTHHPGSPSPRPHHRRRAPPQLVAGRGYASSGSGSRGATKTALIVGSSGALGSSVVRRFRENSVVSRIFGADVVPPRTPESREALDGFVNLARETGEEVDSSSSSSSGGGAATSELLSMTESLTRGLEELDDELGGGAGGGGGGGGKMIPLDAIICTAGGFLGTPDYSSAEDYLVGVETMLRQNLYPVLAASHVAAMRLNQGGLFVAIGATAALAPTPGMLAYGISKSAVHHAVQTLGSDGRKKGQPSILTVDPTASVIGILPTMLDTETNRAGAPEGTDFSAWTKTDDVADEVGRWVTLPDLRPHSGSLIKVFPDKKGDGAMFHLVR